MANDTTYSILPHVFSKLPFDHERDLVPVSAFNFAPMALVIGSESRFKTLSDLVGYAKSNPGKLNYGTGGAGTTPARSGPSGSLRYDIAELARQGDALCLRLSVVRLDRRSFTISIEGEAGGRLKLRAEQVLGTTSLATEHAIDISDDLLAALEVFGVTGSTNPQTPATRIRFAVKSLRWRTC
jgi:hypothetical protein